MTSLSPSSIGTALAGGAKPRRPPVVAWAVLGAVFLLIEAWVIGRWVTTGEAQSTGSGPTPVPDYMLWSIRAIEVAATIGLGAIIWVYLLRPWIRERRLTRDGLLLIAFVTMAWQDTTLNYFRHWFTYNTAAINLGSWDNHIPGWQSPHANLLPLPLAFYAAYGSVVFAAVVFGNWLIRRYAQRHPGAGSFHLLAVAFGHYAAFGVVLEQIFLRAGLYTYPGKVGPTLFAGHYYQYPLLEGLSFISVMTAWWAARFFHDDRGETVAERGADRLRIGEKSRTWVRFLALTGLFNLVFLLFYSLPTALIGASSGDWIKDVQDRSYFMYGCGLDEDPNCPVPP